MQSQLEEISNILSRGESVQLVGLPGSGKSRFLKKIEGIYLDAALLYPADYLLCLRTVARLFGVPEVFSDPVSIQQEIVLKTEDRNQVIIIDGFEKLISQDLNPFFNFLSSLRSMSKNKIEFVFGITGAREIPNTKREILGKLFRQVQENVVYLNPIVKDVFEEILKSDFKDEPLEEIDQDKIHLIYEQSGGIRSLVKVIIRSMAKGKSLDPDENQLLNTQLQEITKTLGDNPSEGVLKRHGLIDDANNIKSKLLNDYMAKDMEKILTASEALLFAILKNRSGEIVSREEICKAVYPDVKNIDGISDNAIDQLIYRLRKKIKKFEITSLHGRGFKLEEN